jgi:hypothetical protein
MGTNAQTTLVSLINSGQMATADIATIANSIKDDLTNGNPIWPGAYSQMSLLYIPNRGVLKVLPGDFVGVDTKGWPILVSALSAGTAASWVHT